jgi:hypothetical protein
LTLNFEHYPWTETECRKLWEDIVRVGEDDQVSVHFLGSVVYVEAGVSNQTERAPLLVIDGQQRLTTMMLIFTALRSALADEDEAVDGFSRRKIEIDISAIPTRPENGLTSCFCHRMIATRLHGLCNASLNGSLGSA